MSFRLRVTLLATAAVAIAVVAASGVVYVVVRHQLLGEVDTSLVSRAQDFVEHPGPDFAPGIVSLGPRAPLGGPPTYLQVIRSDGVGAAVALPGVKQAQAARARPGAAGSSRTGSVQGVHVRVYSAQVGDGLALQVARPLDEVDHTLHRIGLYLLFIGLGGIAIASALGLLVGHATLQPVGRLTAVAEEVTETRDLSRRIGASGAGSRDELGRLASAFDEMLGALDSSLKAQRQLVADASHELRTPLASLRTNVEVLAGGKELPDEERKQLIADVIGQVEELSALVGDLVEIDREAPPELEDVRLDEIVAAVVERARSRTPKVRFDTDLARVGRTGLGSAGRAGGLEPASTTPRSGAATSRSRWKALRSRSATTGRGSPRRTSPTSSTASTARPRRGTSPARASASRSCARSHARTAATRRRRTPPTPGRCLTAEARALQLPLRYRCNASGP